MPMDWSIRMENIIFIFNIILMALFGGNMHWGHSVSKRFDALGSIKAPVIARDSLGHIFSGSSVVDVENTAGYGAGAIIAFLYFCK